MSRRIFIFTLFTITLTCIRAYENMTNGGRLRAPLKPSPMISSDGVSSSVPFAVQKKGRILAGDSRQRQRLSTMQLRTSLGVAVGTIEQSDRIAASPLSPTKRYYAFRGIPYAKPPVGHLRWADPQPLTEVWEGGRLDATKYGTFCPQFDHDKDKVVGNEDCLYLNVFTPVLPGSERREARLPVLVFIHGGAYTRGASSSHGPQRLMREAIVVVTFNYRLGVLGLLSTNDVEIPGNFAALDQVLALKWVRRYISEFGGDSEAVTLGGFSAGASYVHLHTMSPLSQGLFQKTMLMSGAGNCIWSVQEDPWPVAQQLADDLSCPTSSSYSMKECLLLKDVESLLSAQANRSQFVYWPFDYRPVVDQGLRDEPFLPAPVKYLLRTSPSASMPVLVGGTPEEGILFALTVLLFSEKNTNPKHVFDNSAKYIFESLWPNQTTALRVAEALTTFYFSENAQTDANTLVAEMTDAMTDLLFTSCIWDAAANFASLQSPVYTYLMTHHDENSPSFAGPLYRLARAAGVTSPLLKHGVSHGDDVILVFNFPYTLGDMTIRDSRMSLMLTSVVANFVRTGNPQSRTGPQLPPWDPVNPGQPVYYYRLSLSPSFIQKQFKNKERNLWQQTLPQMEETFEESEESQSWQIGFWVVLALLILFLLVVLVSGLFVLRSRRAQQYPGDGATLRSQRPRPSSMAPN